MPTGSGAVVSVAPWLLSDLLPSALQAASFEVVQPAPGQPVHAAVAIVTGRRPPWIRFRFVPELPGPGRAAELDSVARSRRPPGSRGDPKRA